MSVANKAAALVSTRWLRGRLDEGCRKLRLLDTTWYTTKKGHPDYIQKHIPGALYYDVERCVYPTQHIPRNLPELGCYGKYLQSLGINEDSHIVLYDRNQMRASARGWWLLRVHGHPQVSVLHGGLSLWEQEGFDVTDGPTETPKPGNFKVNFQPALIRHFENVESNSWTQREQLLDVRREKDFSGDTEEPTNATIKALEHFKLPLPEKMSHGAVPGSTNLHVDQLYDESQETFKQPGELQKLFQQVGIDLYNQPLAAMCYTGMTACVAALAAASAGKNDTAVYLGSWTEWAQRASQDQCKVQETAKHMKAGG